MGDLETLRAVLGGLGEALLGSWGSFGGLLEGLRAILGWFGGVLKGPFGGLGGS